MRVVLLLLTFSVGSIFGQENLKFFIKGAETKEECKQIDQIISEKDGIIASRTDAHLKQILIRVDYVGRADSLQDWLSAISSDFLISKTAFPEETTLKQSEQSIILVDFPKYISTGDKAADEMRYTQARLAWAKANKETYQSLNGFKGSVSK